MDLWTGCYDPIFTNFCNFYCKDLLKKHYIAHSKVITEFEMLKFTFLSYLSLFSMAKRLRTSSTVTSKNSSGRLSRS